MSMLSNKIQIQHASPWRNIACYRTCLTTNTQILSCLDCHLVLLLSLSSTLQTASVVAGVAAGLAQRHESALLLHLGGDSHELHGGSDLLHGHDLASVLSDLLSGLAVLGEHHELALVGLKSLHVGLQSLHRLVHSSVIHSNSNSAGLTSVDASLLLNQSLSPFPQSF